MVIISPKVNFSQIYNSLFESSFYKLLSDEAGPEAIKG